MAIRPSMHHIIGFKTESISDFSAWQKSFMDEHHEDNFWEFTQGIWKEVGELNDYLKNQFTHMYECVTWFDQKWIPVFGLSPPYHHQESRLHAHDLLYSMTECGLISETSLIKEIPYVDFSSAAQMDHQQRAEAFGAWEARELRDYGGTWYRRYPNHPMHWFDQDFTFAEAFFKKIGLNVERKDIGRFLIVEWG